VGLELAWKLRAISARNDGGVIWSATSALHDDDLEQPPEWRTTLHPRY